MDRFSASRRGYVKQDSGFCAHISDLFGGVRVPCFTHVRIDCPTPKATRFGISMIDQVQITRLANGLTVLTEHMPGLRSVSLGIWVRRGSRHENPELNGICHFIEHALFKGTRTRSAHQIAEESDRLG